MFEIYQVVGKMSVWSLKVIFVLLVILPLVFGGFFGCVQKSTRLSSLHDLFSPGYSSPNLLFVDKAIPDPQMFSSRSDWPSSSAGYRYPTESYYIEKFYDRQSVYHSGFGYMYRYFKSYRYGGSIR